MTRGIVPAGAGFVFFREFLSGVRLLGRGFLVWRTAPGAMALGLIPALIVGAVFVVGFIAIGINLDTLAYSLTPFAERWDEPLRTGTRVIAGLAVLGLAVLIAVYTFTTLTLIIGGPFYERIWRHVEASLGAVPDAGASGFWASLRTGVLDGLRMLLPAVLVGLALLALGLIPLVGTLVASVLGALAGGWLITVELTGHAFDARGQTLGQRRRGLRGRRAMTLGFGTATYLLFLIPLGAVVAMPAAVAGATLLSRKVLAEPIDPPVDAIQTGL